jgi:hypothetical protein
MRDGEARAPLTLRQALASEQIAKKEEPGTRGTGSRVSSALSSRSSVRSTRAPFAGLVNHEVRHPRGDAHVHGTPFGLKAHLDDHPLVGVRERLPGGRAGAARPQE